MRLQQIVLVCGILRPDLVSWRVMRSDRHLHERKIMSDQPTNPIARIISLLRRGPRALLLRFYDQGMRKRTGLPVWDLSRVADGVYVGGQHYPHGWDAMCAYGITAVLNLREAVHDDVALGIGGDLHLHLPTPDNTPIAMEDLDAAANFIHAEIQKGGKVYVHCGVGVGRAPSAAAAYFIKQGQTPSEALALMRRVRPFIHLTGKQQRQLERYAQWLIEQKASS